MSRLLVEPEIGEGDEYSEAEIKQRAIDLVNDGLAGWNLPKTMRLRISTLFRGLLDEDRDRDENYEHKTLIHYENVVHELRHLIERERTIYDLRGEMRDAVERIVRYKLDNGLEA